MQAGTLFNQGVLQNFGTLQMGTLAGNNVGTLQSVDYSYHIRGGLRGINLDASGNLTNKIFSLKLNYEDGSNPYFDGNISKQTWKSSLDGKERSYSYSYDGAARILSGAYLGNGGENYSLNSVTYDANGNIKTLSRNGYKSNNSYGLVDNLDYTYQANSNKIQSVADISGETASFTDVAGSTDYIYSADGSLISDANKGITIEYNYLKLPKKIMKGGTVILNQYDASGRKLKETIGTNVTDYVGNLIYKNNVLYQIGHDEGRVIDGQYEYFINDHLGNLRVSFRDSSGIVKISQKQDYDPYGAELQKISYLKNTWKQSDFKFSGKEFEPQTGLNDFGWRRQDPILGRMWGIDYRAEKYYSQSPMQFAMNNPVSFIEVDGDTTQYYDINNNSLISTINDSSPLNRIKINRHLYDNVFAQYDGVDLTDQINAFAFVGDVTYLAQEVEEVTGVNVLATETGGINMNFNGSTLAVNSIFDDGSTLETASYPASSGIIRQGEYVFYPLPNGNYDVNNPRNNRFDLSGMIRDGVAFSFDINPTFTTGRSALRVHPDGNNRGSEGCIALACDAATLNRFFRTTQNYIRTNGSIPLNVNDPTNPNVQTPPPPRRRNSRTRE